MSSISLWSGSWFSLKCCPKKSFKAYAKKVNADFLCIKEYKDIFKYIPANSFFEKAILEKLNLGDLLNDYERVLYIDADILITPKAKDIFSNPTIF